MGYTWEGLYLVGAQGGCGDSLHVLYMGGLYLEVAVGPSDS